MQQSEEEEIALLSAWLAERGLSEGIENYPLLDENENVQTIIDLAWPDGLQGGLSEPVALLLNETQETQATVSKYGYRYFTSSEDLKDYIESAILK